MNTEQLAEEIIIAAMIRCIEEHANASRVIAWMKDPKRKPAITAFTEGPERQIAYEFERVLASAVDEARNDESTWLVSKAKAEAYEDAAKIAQEVAEREFEVSQDYKGTMVFQSQSYIDAAVAIEEKIREKAKEVGRV